MRWIAEDSLNAALIAVNDPKPNSQTEYLSKEAYTSYCGSDRYAIARLSKIICS